MIGQRCPKCKSKKIRRGYRLTPWFLRMFGIYSLLCDHCNLLFTGFAVPGTVRKHRKRTASSITGQEGASSAKAQSVGN
jgi:hypothetical protein